ncbi:MAG: hypothetical protein HY352_01345 [Candidatus Omnitrophica bacterium]|nr:hypothetical protein [Candidatus Omnitrophota bacterium]
MLDASSSSTVKWFNSIEQDELKERSVFPFLHPRMPNFVLGLAIGLSLALVWHWVAWALH